MAEKVKFSVLFLVVGLIVGLTVGFSFGSQAQAEWKERYVELQKAYNELEKVYENLHLAYLKLKETTFFQVDLLEDKEYYREAFRLISNANKTIYIIMYVVKYDPKEADDPVNILLKGLVEAKKRGVDVKVLVDDETLKSYPQTIDFLLKNSIQVKLDPSKGVRTHTKMVIVDMKYLLVGSHNWTESALTRNHEVTVKIFSTEFSVEAVEYFMKLWVEGRTV